MKKVGKISIRPHYGGKMNLKGGKWAVEYNNFLYAHYF